MCVDLDPKSKEKVTINMSKEQLKRHIWDSFLIADFQDENWNSEDTCLLIVDKILNDSEIVYAKGELPK